MIAPCPISLEPPSSTSVERKFADVALDLGRVRLQMDGNLGMVCHAADVLGQKCLNALVPFSGTRS